MLDDYDVPPFFSPSYPGMDEETTEPTAAPTTALPTVTFRIINPVSGLALNDGDTRSDGMSITLNTVVDGDTAQEFYFGMDNSIINVQCGKAITGSSTCTAVTEIKLSDCTGRPEQQWEIQGAQIVSASDDCDLVLDIFDGQEEAQQHGSTVILYAQDENQDSEFDELY
jgi:hypothetical protein